MGNTVSNLRYRSAQAKSYVMFNHVYIVDDNAGLRELLAWLLESNGYTHTTFDSAENFLSGYDGGNGCLVLDIRMTGMSGLQLQDRLIEDGLSVRLPTIFLTGHGDEIMAERALANGAICFESKPFNNDQLLKCVGRAFATLSIQ